MTRAAKAYRPGAVGALLDLYEEAISDLKKVIADISEDMLMAIVDRETTDENCRSIQTILAHVVSCGYSYATYIYSLKGHTVTVRDKVFRQTVEAYDQDLAHVFTYTQNILASAGDSKLEQFDNALKIRTGWGQLYDIEQMIEHAIVHVLRHKRQIEKIKHYCFR